MHTSTYWKKMTLAVVMVLVAVPVVAQERLTLSDAVARTLANNPDLAVDGPGQEAARLEFKAARAGYLPRLDFEQSYQAGNNPVFVFGTLLSQQKFTERNFALPSLNSPDALDNLQTKATLQQTLWDFGRTKDRREQARLGIEMADQSHQDHMRQIILTVLDGYYSNSLARASIETARLAVRSAESIEAQAKARVEIGLTVEADLLRSRAYLAEARQREIQAQGQLDTAQALLNRLMGNPLSNPIGETASLAPRKVSLPPEEVLVSGQKQHRPDYQNLLTELRQAEIAVSSRHKEFLPVVTGYGTWEADNPSLHEYGGNNWAAGIALRWNIFAGGSDAAQLDAARRRLEQKRRQISALESAMALDIRRSIIQYRTAEQQVAAAQAAEAQSEESLRILRNRYDAGLATMTDLLSAETSRSNARTNLAEAIYRHRLSYAQVEYSAGILSPTSPAMNLQ